MKNIFLTV